ncbi:general substrate transporter [Kockiozyma suomiensis]|uniref:general substrate transporter n=1 Tax=Kockiozyma suomiensis TaxID=1337062 RepID=UPI0033436BD2
MTAELELESKTASQQFSSSKSSSENFDQSAVDHEVAAGVDIESGRPNPFVFLLTILVSFSGFLFGYDTGYISGALTSIGIDLGHELSDGDESFITSATSLGALLGGIIAGTLADVLGRKWVTLGANTLFIVGAIIQAAAHTVWTMIAGRFVMGWGVGIASLIAPLYISEMAPSRFRGRLVILNVLAITGGQVIAYAIGAGLEDVGNGWRVLVGLSIVPATVQMVMFIFMPETPRFLVSRGRIDEAKRVIRWVYSPRHQIVSESLVEKKVKLLEIYNNDQHPEWTKIQRFRYSLRQLLLVPENMRAVIIACMLQGIQQFSGFNSLMYFSSSLFAVVGFDHSTAVSLIVAGTNMVFTILAFILIDRVGRRRILLCTIPGMAISLVVAAIAFHYLPSDATGADPWAIVILLFMMCYVAFYASGIGNVPWQQSELFSMQVRGLGTSLATATNWAGNLTISSTYLTMMKNITPSGTFGLFAGLCMLGWLGVFLMYPETAYLTLEDIQGFLKSGFGIKKSQAMSREQRQKHIAAWAKKEGVEIVEAEHVAYADSAVEKQL